MKKELHIDFSYFSSVNELDETERNLFYIASEIRKNAYAGYSKFLVGCALLLENGEIVTGSNQENAAFPSGLCAERTTIFWTSANYPGVKIKKMFVVGGPESVPETSVPVPPCGSGRACRRRSWVRSLPTWQRGPGRRRYARGRRNVRD